MTRTRKLKILDQAQQQTLVWAFDQGCDLQRIEYVLPFVENDFSLDVWFFFPSVERVTTHDRDGFTRKLAEQFLDTLQAQGGPPELIAGVNCRFVSDRQI